MKVIADTSLDYTGLFTFGDIGDLVAEFSASSGHGAAIAHTIVDWMPAGSLVDFEQMNPLMGRSVVDLARDLALQDTVLAISWDAMSLPFTDPDIMNAKPLIALHDILNGSLDDYIRTVAQQTVVIDLPVMMNLFGESDSHALFGYGPNGDQFIDNVSDTTGQYGDPTALDGPERVRDAFRHVIDIFDDEGADNVTWFQYMASDLLAGGGTLDPSLFYAGDEFIDWVGQSVYVADASELRASFEPGYNAWAAITDRPFFIPEMGLEISGGDEVAALLDGVQGYQKVGAYVWSSFEGIAEDWNVTPIGTDTSDWSALNADTGFARDVIVQDGASSAKRFDAWQYDTGRNVDPTLFEGTGAADYMLGTLEHNDEGDTLIGLGGDDVYLIDHGGDRVVETADGGLDTVLTRVNHQLSEHVENLFADGVAPMTLGGNALNNLIMGNAAANTINGGEGNDVLDGQGGGDLLIGGQGDDTYFINSTSDRLIELVGGGFDTVLSQVSIALDEASEVEVLLLEGDAARYALGSSTDNTIHGNRFGNALDGRGGHDHLEGGDGDDTVSGGIGDDYLDGGSGDDLLDGGLGSDVLFGGAGNDRLILEGGDDYASGGAGADVFEFRSGGSIAVIEDFEAGIDVLDLSAVGLADHSELQAATFHVRADSFGGIPGVDDQIILQFGADDLVLMGVTQAEFDASLILI